MTERDTKTLSRLADDLFKVVEPIESFEEIQRRVVSGGWRCLKHQHGVNFVEDDTLSGLRRVVSLEGVRTVKIREYLPQTAVELPPARKDRYESIVAIFPMYKNSPVFDELMIMGVQSSLSDEELIEILKELILLLY